MYIGYGVVKICTYIRIDIDAISGKALAVICPVNSDVEGSYCGDKTECDREEAHDVMNELLGGCLRRSGRWGCRNDWG